MTQDEARKRLEIELNKKHSFYGFIKLPIHDAMIKDVTNGINEIKEFSFRELIKTAYNLTEKP